MRYLAALPLLLTACAATDEPKRFINVTKTEPAFTRPTLGYVVDGDTIRLKNGTYVRLIGIDTPERGECGYQEAKSRLDSLLEDRIRLVNPPEVDNEDRYDRLIRYVVDNRTDAGLALIKEGLAIARYDSRDGYDKHPREESYVAADADSSALCQG